MSRPDRGVRRRPSSRSGRWARWGRAAAVLALLGGCGLPNDGSPRVVNPKSVPFDLAGPAELNAPDYSAVRPDALAPIQIYLVREGQPRSLVVADRLIPSPVNLQRVLDNLMAGGVTPAEQAKGYANLVPGKEMKSIERTDTTPNTTDAGSATNVDDDVDTGGTVTVEVTPEFFDRFATPEAQRLAIGQIVLTITNYKPATGLRVSRVRFTVGGRTQVVPTGEAGGKVAPILQARQYRPLIGEEADVEPTAPSTSTTTNP